MSSPSIYDELEPVIDHLNGEHEDTALFVMRHLAARCAAADPASIVEGTFTAVSATGIEGRARDSDGVIVDLRWPFADAPTTMDEVRGQMFMLLGEARAAADDDVPLTSLEREFSAASSIRTHLSYVVAVNDINESMREITFGGLAEFDSLGGDEFVYVLLPPEGRTDLTVGVDFSWEAYEQMPVEERPRGAYYTVRRWRPDVGELVADEAGFGAVAAILDQLGESVQPIVQVVAETSTPTQTVDFPDWDGVTVRWLFRNGRPAGSPDALLAAVQELDTDAEQLYAFGAAESRAITAVRKYLRNEVGLPADRVSMTGYWRREAEPAVASATSESEAS